MRGRWPRSRVIRTLDTPGRHLALCRAGSQAFNLSPTQCRDDWKAAIVNIFEVGDESPQRQQSTKDIVVIFLFPLKNHKFQTFVWRTKNRLECNLRHYRRQLRTEVIFHPGLISSILCILVQIILPEKKDLHDTYKLICDRAFYRPNIIGGNDNSVARVK